MCPSDRELKMAATQYNQNLTFNGLGTLSITVPQAGAYFVDGKISLPSLTNGGGVSACLVTINQNGSPVYTGIAGAEGFYTDISCAAADVIAIVFSSAATPDQGLNVIKSTIAIGLGQ